MSSVPLSFAARRSTPPASPSRAIIKKTLASHEIPRAHLAGAEEVSPFRSNVGDFMRRKHNICRFRCPPDARCNVSRDGRSVTPGILHHCPSSVIQRHRETNTRKDTLSASAVLSPRARAALPGSCTHHLARIARALQRFSEGCARDIIYARKHDSRNEDYGALAP